MKKKTPYENWLNSAAWNELDEFWRERVVNILQDLSEFPQLKYAFAVGQDGARLTSIIGPGGKVLKGESSDPKMFFHLSKIVEEYLVHIEHPSPAHVTVELKDEMLFVGSTGVLTLVASFEGNAARGYVGMKLTKRISHLRSIFKASAKGKRARRA